MIFILSNTFIFVMIVSVKKELSYINTYILGFRMDMMMTQKKLLLTSREKQADQEDLHPLEEDQRYQRFGLEVVEEGHTGNPLYLDTLNSFTAREIVPSTGYGVQVQVRVVYGIFRNKG